MSILYLGRRSGTALHRARALRRLGHRVKIVDLRALLVDRIWGLSSTWLARWIRYGGAVSLGVLTRRLLTQSLTVDWGRFDLVHVDEIALVGPNLVRLLENRVGAVSCYVIDDPFGKRDGPKWRLFLKAVPEYDLITVVRESNIQEAYDRGADDVLRVFRSADEVAHAPQDLTVEEQQEWEQDVVFIGSWFPERGPFMKNLLERGVPLTIRGDRWDRADEWPFLKESWAGPSLKPADYTKALQCAKVCLGLLSKENRDKHTQRSMEIPFIGSVLCAERTDEHLYLYEEDEEAVFWDDATECAEKCFDLLDNDAKRRKVAKKGRSKCIRNGFLNENVMSKVINTVK